MTQKELFEFLVNNLAIDTRRDYDGYTELRLLLKNPETGEYKTISETWID